MGGLPGAANPNPYPNPNPNPNPNANLVGASLVPGTTSEWEESRAHCCTPRSSHGWKTSGWPFMTSAAETGGSVLCTELCTWLGLG